jgi:hypothetical protein
MPIAHQKQQHWSPQRVEDWARDIGQSTEQIVMYLLQAKPHPEQSYRVYLGLLSLAKKYTPERLEAACHRAHTTGAIRLKAISTILEKGLDTVALPEQQPDLLSAIPHHNIRGHHYYH